MRFTIFAVLSAALAALSSPTPSTSSDLHSLVAYAPPITSPTAGDEWVVGQKVTVTWDNSNVPEEAKDYTSTILLGYLTVDDGDNEHLNHKQPLAQNVPIASGAATFIVPDVESRSDYIVVLIGDSGDASTKFTIKRSEASRSSRTHFSRF